MKRWVRSRLISNEPDGVTEPQSVTEDAGESRCHLSTWITSCMCPNPKKMDSRVSGIIDELNKEIWASTGLTTGVVLRWKLSGDSRYIRWHVQTRQISVEIVDCGTVPPGKILYVHETKCLKPFLLH